MPDQSVVDLPAGREACGRHRDEHGGSAPERSALLGGPAPDRASEPVASASEAPEPGTLAFLPHALVATALIALLPTFLVWWLRSAGLLSSYPLSLALALLSSLAAGYAGALFWQRRAASRDLLFGDLMIWRYAMRCRRERQLRSARAILGIDGRAQLRPTGGLTAQRQLELFEGLAAALDARDPNTHGHSRRVAHYAWAIASRMGLPAEQVTRIRTAAAMHDVGKVHTPRAILRKPGKLTDAEYEVMKRHPADGAQMVEVLQDKQLSSIVRHHHERLDGTGYPDRLRGEDIPLGARIIAVADTFDAMTASRPYRSARAHREALEVLAREAGTKLDAEVVSAFSRHYSGRRSIALWSSLSTLPTRIASLLNPGAAGLGSAARTAAALAVVGGAAVAASTPARSTTHRPSAARRVAARAADPLGPAALGDTAATGRSTAGRTPLRGGRRLGVGAHPETTGLRPVVSAKSPGATPAASPATAAGAPVAQTPSDTAPAGTTASREGILQHIVEAATGSARTATQAPEAVAKSAGEAVKRTSEPVQAVTENVKQAADETATQVKETVTQGVEKVTSTVEETNAKVLETVKALGGDVTSKLGLGGV